VKEPFLPLRADGNTLKLTVADDNGIIVAGGDTGAEFLAVVGFKVLLGTILCSTSSCMTYHAPFLGFAGRMPGH